MVVCVCVSVCLSVCVCSFIACEQDSVSNLFRIEWSSPVTPLVAADVDLIRRTVTPVWADTAPDLRSKDFDIARLSAASADGTRVPITVVRSRQRGNRGVPVLLSAYGAYGISVDVGYDASNVRLLQSGWALAFAHTRCVSPVFSPALF